MDYRFMRFPDGKPKAVTFSYDDGFCFDVPVADTLWRYGMKATFNFTGVYDQEKRADEMPSDNITIESFRDFPITKDEISAHILGQGHEIAVHGFSHLAPGSLRTIDGIRDILDCRIKLEKDFGHIVRGMAYPDTGISLFVNGCNYEKVKEYLMDLDIAYARTAGDDNFRFDIPTDWHAWMPTVRQTNPKLFDYIENFLTLNVENSYPARRYPRLFYLCGHSFEFYTTLGFETLINVCEKLAHRDEIWYATNMEIYNYVKAYESLIFSADGNIVYNPSLIKVYFDIGGKIYSVEPNQTLIMEQEM